MNKKDFEELYLLQKTDYSKKIDEWLVNVVLPEFTGKGQGFEVPATGISIKAFENILKSKGFNVTTNTDYQGSFVYFYDDPNEFKG